MCVCVCMCLPVRRGYEEKKKLKVKSEHSFKNMFLTDGMVSVMDG